MEFIFHTRIEIICIHSRGSISNAQRCIFSEMTQSFKLVGPFPSKVPPASAPDQVVLAFIFSKMTPKLLGSIVASRRWPRAPSSWVLFTVKESQAFESGFPSPAFKAHCCRSWRVQFSPDRRKPGWRVLSLCSWPIHGKSSINHFPIMEFTARTPAQLGSIPNGSGFSEVIPILNHFC